MTKINKPIKSYLDFSFTFLTQLGTKCPHLPVVGIQISSYEGPHLFPRGDLCQIMTISKSSRTTRSISTKLNTKHPWVKGNKICWNDSSFPKEHNTSNGILKIHWHSFQNKCPIFNQTWHIVYACLKQIPFCTNLGHWRDHVWSLFVSRTLILWIELF